MHFQLKPESEYTNQGYLYLMEKSKLLTVFSKLMIINIIYFFSSRSLYSDMAKILLYLQEAKQTILDAPI